MTQRDKWLKVPRPPVMRYWGFRDTVRWRKVTLPTEGAKVTFIMPMPKSWSKKKKAEMNGKPHTQKPDITNLIKALEDACYTDDSYIWQYKGLEKLWGTEGKIIIEVER